MIVAVPMPKWGDTMQEGVIVEWMVAVGEQVAQGEVLATVETEKVEAELEATAAGVIVELLADEGDAVPVGDAVARIEAS